MTTHAQPTPPTALPAARRLAAAVLAAWGALAQASQAPQENFANLSLEELTNIQITSVSRKAERLGDAPASVYVIRRDEIRRAGVATLPEALRLAPNLQVARVDARNYAVSARGFNNVFSNKMLVLVDGRAVYSPLFSGVFWDAQDLVIEDIERIEVISGPGATVWGANAVNGVINVITRPAGDTPGTLAVLAASSDLHSATVRHGARAGAFAYRVYGKAIGHDDTVREDGAPSPTGWRRRQAGFRADGELLGGDMTLQGDAYKGSLHQARTAHIGIEGANLLARHTRKLAGGSELRLQAWFDHTGRDQPGAFREHLNTVDVEAQHTLRLSPSSQLIWGGGHRVAHDRVRPNGNSFAFLPAERDLTWTNAYAQGESQLSDSVRMTAGLKIERNSYTGPEWLPYLGVAWHPAPQHMLWASAQRAVRVPSRIDRDFYAPASPPLVDGVPQYVVAGGPQFDAEVARVVQLGYRGQPAPGLSYALTLHASEYNHLRTIEPNPSGPGSVFLNRAHGNTQGVEFSGNWDVTPGWRLTAGHTVQQLDLRTEPGSMDISASTGVATNDPRSWSMLRSSLDLSARAELDLTLRRVGRLPRPEVPAYTALDLRLGWQWRPGLELSVLARNLLASPHPEFGAPGTRNVFDRTIVARLAWHF